jgi:two-component sensor histidine kinase
LTDLLRTEELLDVTLHRKDVVELFLKEIHHRVKNNLQVVSSLVRLQSDTVDDPALRRLFESVQDQVRAMTLVHEKLYQTGDLAHVDFADYAQSMLGQLWQEHRELAGRVGLSLDLQPLSMPVDSALPCGLVLNELATNALRHAFRGRDEGEVAVEFCTGEDGRASLRVRDNGVGMPPNSDWETCSTFGLRLVKALVSQLGGTVEVVSGPGTEFRVAFPVPVGTSSA